MSRIASINVGTARAVEFRGRQITTAIYKVPVEGPVTVAGVNLAGEDQADRSVHGGEDKAVYSYAAEDYRWWSAQLDRSLGPGTFGENVTTEDMNVGGAVVGERWRIGDVLLEVSEPRMPCYKLGIRMDDARFPAQFSKAERPGAYLRIIKEGDIAAGDTIHVEHTPGDGITVADVARIYTTDRDEAHLLLEIVELSTAWKRWASSTIDSHGG